MITPEVPEFVINPENIRKVMSILMGLAFLGSGCGGAIGYYMALFAGVVKMTFDSPEMDEVNAAKISRLINVSAGIGAVVGSIGTVVTALIFSR